MIVDLGESDVVPPRYDVCIIGSGPAGITVARELGEGGVRCCVLESGLAARSAHADALKDVRSEGIHVKDYSRERVLGGASTTWAGLSSPLDPIDMEERPWLRAPGWPIPRDELLPWYARAAERYRFAPLAHFEPGGFARLRAKGALEPRFETLEEKVFLAAEPPQNFGREHRAVFERDADLYLDASVVALEARPGTRAIAAARARTRRGREVLVEAEAFVLAAGGIENARLLLCSRDLCAAGLGNEHDQVGRWFMNHPKNYHGVLRLAEPVERAPYFFGCLFEGYAGYAGMRLPDAMQRARRLQNAYVRLEPLFPWSDNAGVESLVLLAKKSRFLLDAWKKKAGGGVVELRDYAETGDDSDLQNARKGVFGWVAVALRVFLHLPSVFHYAWFRLVPGQRPRVRRIRLRNFMEMEPDPENRVTLHPTERDAHGLPLPLVRHRCTPRDRESMVAVHEAFAAEVFRLGLGAFESDLAAADPWPIDQDASHHLGTTRMGEDPATSVVDAQCRIHGVDNVYVAGGSVFPTSGCANPTFTLVALAIRLAHHLRTRLASERAPGDGAARGGAP